jgi:adenylate cyclase
MQVALSDGSDRAPPSEALLDWYRGNTEARRRENAGIYHKLVPAPDHVAGDGAQIGRRSARRLKSEGYADYVAQVLIGEMDCIYSHWTTRKADGFSEEDCAALRRLVPALALAWKSASLARIAGTLVEVYLGRDAGERVLRGRISRGVAERIHAVLWFSDLRGFTSIADRSNPAEIIPLLNDYADAVISAVHQADGDVLKLLGDGILAIFHRGDRVNACRAALSAEADLRRRIHELNERRRSESSPISSVRVGLHLGDVLFGNIGSDTRLDFTVVGPAVNEEPHRRDVRSVDRRACVGRFVSRASSA